MTEDAPEVSLSNSRRHFSKGEAFESPAKVPTYRWLGAAEEVHRSTRSGYYNSMRASELARAIPGNFLKIAERQ